MMISRPMTAGIRLLAAGLLLFLCAKLGWSEVGSPNPLIAIRTPQGAVIHAELADTPFKRARGLMYRESLPDDRGMLFIFGESQAWSFWMKNTRMALDIIWLNERKKIVHVESNVPVCTLAGDGCPQYQSNEPAMYVLELRGGRAQALHLTRGTTLQF